MSTNKLKKKKKNKQTFNWKKWGIYGGIVAFLIGLVIVIGVATKDKYYDCVQYDWYEKVNLENVQTMDGMKNDYEFYRIFLNDDGTFELKYRLKNGTMTYVDKGTYTKTKTELVLTYSSPTQEPNKVCTYTIDGKKLIRDEFVNAIDGTRVTVKQEFVLK